jgi:hypothetical protein
MTKGQSRMVIGWVALILVVALFAAFEGSNSSNVAEAAHKAEPKLVSTINACNELGSELCYAVTYGEVRLAAVNKNGLLKVQVTNNPMNYTVLLEDGHGGWKRWTEQWQPASFDTVIGTQLRSSIQIVAGDQMLTCQFMTGKGDHVVGMYVTCDK